jgi:ribosomal protein S1
MNKTIGNEALADIFDDVKFSPRNKKRQQTKEFKQMLKMYKLDKVYNPEIGQVISAKYIGKSDDQFIFNIEGFKDDIRIDDKLGESKYLKNLNIGDTIDLLITDINQNTYMIKGSVASLYESRARADIKALNEGESVIATINSLNPAGYDVEINYRGVTLSGFMPNTLAGINKLYNPESIVGDTFDVMIESYSENEGTYIVSRRRYLQTLIPEAIKNIDFNKMYTGYVTGTTPFGIFVEFDKCLTGMIHKANITPEWADRISDIKPGFKIDFYIKEVIKNKIILTQIIRETLWDNIYNGQIIEGIVKDSKSFGTLVNLDDETVGLIHTSELEKIGKNFAQGQKVKVKVLLVDRSTRKIFLTIA